MLQLVLLLQDTAMVMAADTMAQAADTVVSPGTEYALEGVSLFLAGGLGVLGAIVLDLVKKGLALVGKADAAIVKVLKPLQPAIVAVLSIGLPLLTNMLGWSEVPDATIFASAPIAGLIGTVGREYALKLFGPKK